MSKSEFHSACARFGAKRLAGFFLSEQARLEPAVLVNVHAILN